MPDGPDDGSSDAGGPDADGSDAGDSDGGPRFDREAVFDPETYLHFYADHLTDDRADREAAFLADALDLAAGDRVLDCPCGHGRISNRLAAAGYDVAGLDASEGFLDRARADAAERGVEVDYVHGDMRDLPWPDGHFDAAFNLFTSFGYFDDAGNRRTLREAARVLRPGGRFLVETVNRDHVLREFQPAHVTEVGDDYLVDRSAFDPTTGRMRTDRLTVRDGETSEATYSVRLYTYTELVERFEAAGLDVVAAYGTTDGDDYGIDQPRLVVVGENPAE